MEQVALKEKYDAVLESLDWRYSAAIVGLYEYLSFYEFECEVTEDCLWFHSEDVTEEGFLKFVENRYYKEMYHTQIEEILSLDEISDEQVKLVNEFLKGNSVMKNVFGKIKLEESTKESILLILKENRMQLIKETFRNKSNMYANIANTGQLFMEAQSCCRLVGYYIDGAKKGKSASYQFDPNTNVLNDIRYFDFIAFAFSGRREFFFINDNYTVRRLIQTNRIFQEYIQREEKEQGKPLDTRELLFQMIKSSSNYIDYDVEVIRKNKEASYFETMFIRKESIQILKNMKDYKVFCFSFKVNENFYINIQQKVTECILNVIRTDELIELLLKDDVKKEKDNHKKGFYQHGYRIKQLIELNVLICGGGNDMKKSMQGAFACAKTVASRIPDNKLTSYRHRLTSAIVFKDYDRVCQILLQLSNYSEVPFGFAFQLFEDFEGNKDVAYTFINALSKQGNE